MTEKKIKEAVKAALDPVYHKALHPEDYDNLGYKLRKYEKRYREPMEPRHRLSTRLFLLAALKEVEIELSKAILADAEAVEDAKKHKETKPDGQPMPKLREVRVPRVRRPRGRGPHHRRQ